MHPNPVFHTQDAIANLAFAPRARVWRAGGRGWGCCANAVACAIPGG